MKEFVAKTPSLQEILEERFQAKKKKKKKVNDTDNSNLQKEMKNTKNGKCVS